MTGMRKRLGFVPCCARIIHVTFLIGPEDEQHGLFIDRLDDGVWAI
jgi:hypothetical protein